MYPSLMAIEDGKGKCNNYHPAQNPQEAEHRGVRSCRDARYGHSRVERHKGMYNTYFLVLQSMLMPVIFARQALNVRAAGPNDPFASYLAMR